MSKRKYAYVTMRVISIRSRPCGRLLDFTGEVLESNFIGTNKKFSMPVMTIHMDKVNNGDTVRLSYLTTDEELRKFNEGLATGFNDLGLKYEILTSDGWERIYSD